MLDSVILTWRLRQLTAPAPPDGGAVAISGRGQHGTAAENDDLVKFVSLSGPGVDALEARKETNNHHKVTAKELRNSFEKVKSDLFSGLAALLRT